MDKKYYSPFGKVVFRTPLFPFDVENVEYRHSPLFDEALFLASREIYDEKQKAEVGPAVRYDEKLKWSLHKYYSRASSRCTPFGLFAGCSVGYLDEKSEISLEEVTHDKRCTRLDMEYLCALIQHLEQRKEIQMQLKYYPNDSIYEIGGKLRYVEYYYKGALRVHQIMSVENSGYISEILDVAKRGMTISDLASTFDWEDISSEEITDFIFELIGSQLLKSELEVCITGDNPFSVLIRKLAKLQGIDEIVTTLKKLQEVLLDIDARPIGTTINLYSRITDLIREINVDFQSKYLFQTDLFKTVKKATISSRLVDEVYDVMVFLNRINSASWDNPLSEFKKAFLERYEEEEVPLNQALDSELGIGYPVRGNRDINTLIDDLILPDGPDNNLVYGGRLQKILFEKYIEVLSHQKRILTLSDADFAEDRPDWNYFPDTLAAMCSVIRADEGEEQLYMKFAGGSSSAAALLSRFCHLDTQIAALARQITEREQEQHPELIYAEIVHLPRARVGNILSRPVLRPYEIHYLANPGVEADKQIPVSDLTLSLKAGRLVLMSRRYQKEIVPRLTNAHNFRSDSMPVYYFLCDLQYQHQSNGLAFHWGGYFDQLDYLPRVMYKNHILAREKWCIRHVKWEEIRKLPDHELLGWADRLRADRNIPSIVVIPEGDNELVINLADPLSLRMMLSVVKKKSAVFMEEFLFEPEHAIVKCQQEIFVNEFIFTFYKNE